MKRMLGLMIVVGLVGGMGLVSGPAEPPDGGEAVVPRPAPVVVCPVMVDRSTDGSITLSARVPGTVVGTAFAAGVRVVEVDADVDATGGGRLQYGDLVTSGLAAFLLELPDLDMAAGVTVTGIGVAEGNCTSPSAATTMAVGASTRGGERLDLLLANPYAVDAVASVSSSSEAGVDSASELETVIVPAGSVVIRDVAALLPLRNRLSMTITAEQGRVHGFLLQESGSDRALIEAVGPGASWELPLGPSIEGVTETLVVASSMSVDTVARLDGLIDGGWVEGLWEATIPARSQVEIDLGTLVQRPAAVRVGADGLIAASIVMENEDLRAAGPLVPFESTDWFIAGGAAGTVQAILAVPGDIEAIVTVFPHSPGARPIEVTVPAGTSTSLPLPTAQGGYTLRSSSDMIVAWTSVVEGGLSVGAAVPVAEVGE